MSRLSEVLNVPEGQEFEYEGNKLKIIINKIFIINGRGDWCELASARFLMDMIASPEKIRITPTKPKLSKQQITAIKGRIAEGTPWAVKDISGEEIAFYSSTPCSEDYYATSMNAKMYDFLKVGQAVYLPDLIEDKIE